MGGRGTNHVHHPARTPPRAPAASAPRTPHPRRGARRPAMPTGPAGVHGPASRPVPAPGPPPSPAHRSSGRTGAAARPRPRSGSTARAAGWRTPDRPRAASGRWRARAHGRGRQDVVRSAGPSGAAGPPARPPPPVRPPRTPAAAARAGKRAVRPRSRPACGHVPSARERTPAGADRDVSRASSRAMISTARRAGSPSRSAAGSAASSSSAPVPPASPCAGSRTAPSPAQAASAAASPSDSAVSSCEFERGGRPVPLPVRPAGPARSCRAARARCARSRQRARKSARVPGQRGDERAPRVALVLRLRPRRARRVPRSSGERSRAGPRPPPKRRCLGQSRPAGVRIEPMSTHGHGEQRHLLLRTRRTACPSPGRRSTAISTGDVCIVGGGLSGLWTAYTLGPVSTPTLDIVVLEARARGLRCVRPQRGMAVGRAVRPRAVRRDARPEARDASRLR